MSQHTTVKTLAILVYVLTFIIILSVIQITKLSPPVDHLVTETNTQHQDLKRAVSSYGDIESILKDIQVRYKSQTVLLYRLHQQNFGIDLHGGLLVSAANMSDPEGIIDPLSAMNIPAQTFSSIFPQLLNGLNIDITTSDLQSGPLKELLTKESSKQSEWIPLMDSNSQLIGMLNVNWANKDNIFKQANYTEMIQYLRDKNRDISKYFGLPHVPD